MAITESSLINAGIQAGLVSTGELAEMRLRARRDRERLIDVVTRVGRFPELALYQAFAALRNIPFLETKDLVPEPETLERIPANLIQRRSFLPVRTRQGERYLAMVDPDDHTTLDAARRFIAGTVRPALADPQALEALIAQIYKTGEDEEEGTETVDSVDLLDRILHEAYLYRASDIHLEPSERGMRVRLRVDGQMQEYRRRFDRQDRDGIITRIKVLSQLDISEHRDTQDGGFSYALSKSEDSRADIRVATVPTRWGERITLRILSHESASLSLDKLGMPASILGDFRRALTSSHGIMLVTGPTGGGKSTTLYAALRELDSDTQNILTVEDPVEQIIPGITQVNVGGKLNFARTLRSFLRHDPDVLLVGEIRDSETADTALKAALTGHLVLATLHTNDSPGAVTRLIDIGCERYLIAASLLGVMAQRLVRRLCPTCKDKRAADAEESALLGLGAEGAEIYTPVGCPICLGTGYLGRVGVFEALWCDDEMSAGISEGQREDVMRQRAKRYEPFGVDARNKVLAGDTSLEEMTRLDLMGT